MIVREHDIFDRLVGDAADILDNLAGEPWGGLRIDDHHGVVADNHAGVRIALGRKRPEVLTDFGEGNLLFRKVALRSKCFCHSQNSLFLLVESWWRKAVTSPQV